MLLFISQNPIYMDCFFVTCSGGHCVLLFLQNFIYSGVLLGNVKQIIAIVETKLLDFIFLHNQRHCCHIASERFVFTILTAVRRVLYRQFSVMTAVLDFGGRN